VLPIRDQPRRRPIAAVAADALPRDRVSNLVGQPVAIAPSQHFLTGHMMPTASHQFPHTPVKRTQIHRCRYRISGLPRDWGMTTRAI
jgi:hypothetical protein